MPCPHSSLWLWELQKKSLSESRFGHSIWLHSPTPECRFHANAPIRNDLTLYEKQSSSRTLTRLSSSPIPVRPYVTGSIRLGLTNTMMSPRGKKNESGSTSVVA